MMELNKIYNEDCIEGLKRASDNSIDVIITDPPYFTGMTHNGAKGEFVDLNLCKPFFSNVFAELKRVLKGDGKIYWFCDWRTYPFYYPIIIEFFPIKNLLVWDKGSAPGSAYTFAHELTIFGMNKVVPMKGSNVIRIPGFSGGAKRTNGEKVHPTQKTVEIIEKYILDSTKEGDVVLDCFAGSGTTAVAAIRTNRQYICFELQEKYCRIAEGRINKEKQQLKLDT